MNLLIFNTLYPCEASCKAKWKEQRGSQDVEYMRCGSKDYYRKADKECYECKNCLLCGLPTKLQQLWRMRKNCQAECWLLPENR